MLRCHDATNVKGRRGGERNTQKVLKQLKYIIYIYIECKGRMHENS